MPVHLPRSQTMQRSSLLLHSLSHQRAASFSFCGALPLLDFEGEHLQASETINTLRPDTVESHIDMSQRTSFCKGCRDRDRHRVRGRRSGWHSISTLC